MSEATNQIHSHRLTCKDDISHKLNNQPNSSLHKMMRLYIAENGFVSETNCDNYSTQFVFINDPITEITKNLHTRDGYQLYG